MTALVPILMGSRSDQKHAQTIADALAQFGIDSEMHVASAHKIPTYLLKLLEQYEADPRAEGLRYHCRALERAERHGRWSGLRAGDRVSATLR